MSSAFLRNHIVNCSAVFDPFQDMVKWLNDIAQNKSPASLEIDEEGIFTTLSIIHLDDTWLEFRVHRQVPESLGVGACAADRLILCRVRKYQLLSEFYRRLQDFLQHDYRPRCWDSSGWQEFLFNERTLNEVQDLNGLDLAKLDEWLRKHKVKPGNLTIISGGQTGVDRAALDFAIEYGFEHAGWCPKGRLAEDGVIHRAYMLAEMDDAKYHKRTRQNVLDSDATLILNLGALDGGTLLTQSLAEKQRKRCLMIQLDGVDLSASIKLVLDWLREHEPTRLNVAGPRESKRPRIYQRSYKFLVELQDAF
jgi:hypothetical protein